MDTHAPSPETFGEQKRLLGQFFTVTNPFKNHPFRKWWKEVERDLGPSDLILEPFAGANNIVKLMAEIGVRRGWACFDIEPPSYSQVENIKVVQQDTILHFPSGFKVAITNPPYLAKNSATRRGLPFPETDLSDLYQVALRTMLAECPYVAAIIPASFLTQECFLDRVCAVIELNCRMFSDTECPVCLALFKPGTSTDFDVYRGDSAEPLGTFTELKRALPPPRRRISWKFNAADGQIGLRAIDNNREPSIEFLPGEAIDGSEIRVSSRHITRIKAPAGWSRRRISSVIANANDRLDDYRTVTHDILMSPFKGLREDGRYRRRLDFAQARQLLDLASS
jgi:hypothetical protein